MAKCFPKNLPDNVKSPAEKVFFKLLAEQLDDEYTIFHSREWITRIPGFWKPEGEVDFLIAHPERGLLVIEVKGGKRFYIREGQWISVSQNGEEHKCNDPFLQAKACEYAIKDWLEAHPKTKAHSFPIHRAVAFPDIVIAEQDDISPYSPRKIIVDRSQQYDLAKAIADIYDYWHQRYVHTRKPGRAGIEALERLLIPSRTLESPISAQFEDQERQIKHLTESQFTLLTQLRYFRRVAIMGGAGSGKTMLAIEKAQQLADDGWKVLLLCYNNNLRDWLESVLRPNVKVRTYHSLASEAHNCWVQSQPLAVDDSTFYEQAPYILSDALDRIRAQQSLIDKYLFDAVIIDEGQDFGKDHWIPVEDLLKDREQGILYVFFDGDQTIYSGLDIPIAREQPPILLSENCRNIQSIFKLLKKYSTFQNDMKCIGPEGLPVEFLPGATPDEARDSLRKKLHELINENRGIDSRDVIVLTPRKAAQSMWKQNMHLGNFRLVWNLKPTSQQDISVCTIHSFKGLERPIVFLTELNEAFETTRNQLLYIGISRARLYLIIIGDTE